MMTQKVILECLFVLVADEGRRRRRKIANWDGAHPSPVPPQGHSCNQPHHSLFNVIIITIAIITIHDLGVERNQKLEPHAAQQDR